MGSAVVVGIVLLAGIVLQSGGGGGNFQLTAYSGANQLGGSTVMFDDVKRLATGKPIVLNLWGGSCPPCRAETPGFQRAYDRNSDDFLMIGLDVGPFFGLGTRNSAVQLLNDLQITYPTAFATSRDPVAQFGANALPSTFFFDKDGNLDSKEIGFINERDCEQRLRELIDEPVASAGVGGGHNG
jgi:thiol-disulfide isomerase/thioredoxin